MNLLVYFAIAAFVVFADLFTKYLVKGSEVLMSGGSIEIIPGVFRLKYVGNPGAAMGSLIGNRWVFMLFSTVAIVVIAVYFFRNRKAVRRLCGVALALIMGGGIGNMYERLFNKNAQGIYVVTDFFDFYFFDFWKWVFNVADVAVCVGAGLMVLHLILEFVQEYRASKHPELYDELVALDAIVPDEESVGDLMAVDGAEVEAVSPLDLTDGEGAFCEERELSEKEDGKDAYADEAYDENDLDELAALDGYGDESYASLDEEDSFPVTHADDVDLGDEEEDFFVEDDDKDEDLL